LPGFFIFTKNRPDESPAFFLSEKHPASPGSDHRPPMALIRKLHVGQTRRRPSSETSRRTALALKVRRGRPKAGETLVLPGVPGGRVGSCRVFLFSPRIGRTKVRPFFFTILPVKFYSPPAAPRRVHRLPVYPETTSTTMLPAAIAAALPASTAFLFIEVNGVPQSLPHSKPPGAGNPAPSVVSAVLPAALQELVSRRHRA